MILKSLIFVALALTASFSPSQAQPPQLIITVLIDVEDYVTISGKIALKSGEAVPEAVVSVQVVSPFGSTIHLARLFTDRNGAFSTRCTLTPRVTVGKYAVSVTASREGYADAYFTASFIVSHEDFYLSISPNVLLARQGDSAILNIDVIGLAGFNQTVSLTIGSTPPRGVSYKLSNETARANATVILSIATSLESATGNYSLLITGWSGVRSRSASATLIITQRQTELLIPALLIGILAFVIIGLIITRRRLQAVLRGEETQLSQEYLTQARALVRLEELRATDRIDEPAYQKLRKEYEERLERLRERRGPQ